MPLKPIVPAATPSTAIQGAARSAGAGPAAKGPNAAMSILPLSVRPPQGEIATTSPATPGAMEGSTIAGTVIISRAAGTQGRAASGAHPLSGLWRVQPTVAQSLFALEPIDVSKFIFYARPGSGASSLLGELITTAHANLTEFEVVVVKLTEELALADAKTRERIQYDMGLAHVMVAHRHYLAGHFQRALENFADAAPYFYSTRAASQHARALNFAGEMSLLCAEFLRVSGRKDDARRYFKGAAEFFELIEKVADGLKYRSRKWDRRHFDWSVKKNYALAMALTMEHVTQNIGVLIAGKVDKIIQAVGEAHAEFAAGVYGLATKGLAHMATVVSPVIEMETNYSAATLSAKAHGAIAGLAEDRLDSGYTAPALREQIAYHNLQSGRAYAVVHKSLTGKDPLRAGEARFAAVAAFDRAIGTNVRGAIGAAAHEEKAQLLAGREAAMEQFEAADILCEESQNNRSNQKLSFNLGKHAAMLRLKGASVLFDLNTAAQSQVGSDSVFVNLHPETSSQALMAAEWFESANYLGAALEARKMHAEATLLDGNIESSVSAIRALLKVDGIDKARELAKRLLEIALSHLSERKPSHLKNVAELLEEIAAAGNEIEDSKMAAEAFESYGLWLIGHRHPDDAITDAFARAGRLFIAAGLPLRAAPIYLREARVGRPIPGSERFLD